MGKHKQVACEICFKYMRSDNLKRHCQNKHILSCFTSSSTKQTTEKCGRPCPQSRKKFKDGEAPDIKRNGGNDSGSYKHHPSQNQSQTQQYTSAKEQVHQQPMQTQPTDWDLMEDSIQVFKIYKLLQRMKNK